MMFPILIGCDYTNDLLAFVAKNDIRINSRLSISAGQLIDRE